jgi:hypothetical protein
VVNGTFDLYARRQAEASISFADWLIYGDRGLAALLGRAQSVLASRQAAEEAQINAARASLELGARGSTAVPRLYRCLEDSFAAKDSAGSPPSSFLNNQPS